jgi:cytoskeleton protein RodZ
VTEIEAGESGTTGPGTALRLAREQLGLSQQQAAEQLTLDVSVITALDADDFATLGADVFVKGHLRRYAALLGLPEGDVLASYDRSKAHLEPPSLIPRARIEMMPERSEVNWGWVVGGAALLLLAAGLVAYLSEYGFRLPGRSGGGTDVVAIAGPAPDDSATLGPTSAAPDMTPSPGAGSVPDGQEGSTADAGPAPALPAGHVSLSVSFAADSWAEIYDGSGKAVLYDLGKAGSRRTIAAAAPLSVTFGNAPAVTLAVNGRATPLPPVPAGQTVARFSVGTDGTLR